MCFRLERNSKVASSQDNTLDFNPVIKVLFQSSSSFSAFLLYTSIVWVPIAITNPWRVCFNLVAPRSRIAIHAFEWGGQSSLSATSVSRIFNYFGRLQACSDGLGKFAEREQRRLGISLSYPLLAGSQPQHLGHPPVIVIPLTNFTPSRINRAFEHTSSVY